MFYNNLLSIPILLVCSGLVEDWSASNVHRIFPTVTRNHLAAGMVYSGLVAILISYCAPWCIRATSATAYAMVGALTRLGVVFFASAVTVAGAGAIVIGVVSGVVYTWTKTPGTASRGLPVEPNLPLQGTRQKSWLNVQEGCSSSRCESAMVSASESLALVLGLPQVPWYGSENLC